MKNKTVGKNEMKTGTVISLNFSDRQLGKARLYIADMEAFLSDTPTAVSILLDALPRADTALKLKILPLLGYAGKDHVLRPLYHLIFDDSQDEQVRSSAALHLGVAASLSDDPSVLTGALIEHLQHTRPHIRRSCALALGWEGNWPAVGPLMKLLSDSDRDVQLSVVTALSSVGDLRVFDLLVARLETSTGEEQRSILLNLWRFSERVIAAEAVYLQYLQSDQSDLRLDVLSGLAMLPLSKKILSTYQTLLMDDDPRIRKQVLENLFVSEPGDYEVLSGPLRRLLEDNNPKVRQTAIRLFAKG